jgi:hypothetical protein
VYEEARARVKIDDLYALFNLPHIDQVYLIFRARLLDLNYRPGEESLEVGLFGEAETPWDTLAFTIVRESLRLYFDDRRAGAYRVHIADIPNRDPGVRGSHAGAHSKASQIF